MQDAAAKLREEKVKIMTGGGSDEFYKTLRAENKANLDLYKVQTGVGTQKIESFPEGGQMAPGRYEPQALGLQKKVTTITPYTPPGAAKIAPPEIKSVTGGAEGVTAQSLEAERKASEKAAQDWIDAEIAKLEGEAAGLEIPKYTGVSDFTTAGRRAFAQTMGTGGFGIQPRPGRVQPTYYESEAIAQTNEVERQAIANEYQMVNEARAKMARDRLAKLKAKAAELESIDEPIPMDLAAKIKRQQDLIANPPPFTPDQEARIISNARDRMVSNYDILGAVPVSRRDFLRPYREPEISSKNPEPVEKPERSPRIPWNPPGTDREDPFFLGPRGVNAPDAVAKLTTSKPQEVIDIEGSGPYSGASTDPFQGAGRAPARSMLKTKYTPSEKVSEPTIPVEDWDFDFGSKNPYSFNIDNQDKKALAAQEMVAAYADAQKAAQFGESDPAKDRAALAAQEEYKAILREDRQQMPRPAGARSSFGRMEISPDAAALVEQRGGESVPLSRRPAGIADRAALRRLEAEVLGVRPTEQNVKTGGGRDNLPDAPPLEPDFGSPEYFEGYQAPTEQDINIRRGGPIKTETNEAAGASTMPVTKETRRDLYLSRTIKNGLKLAEKPAKVERLAKTSLDQKEREMKAPKYIIVVDKLYEVNRGKPDAFAKTFAEINRAFAADQPTRSKAHEYLVAKDALEEDTRKPIA